MKKFPIFLLTAPDSCLKVDKCVEKWVNRGCGGNVSGCCGAKSRCQRATRHSGTSPGDAACSCRGSAGPDCASASLSAALPVAAWEPIRDKVLAASSLNPQAARSSACWSVTRVEETRFRRSPAGRAGACANSPSSKSRSGWSGRVAISKSGRMPAGKQQDDLAAGVISVCRRVLRIWRCERAVRRIRRCCCEEAVEALAVKPSGIYVDATFGRGGHSRAILANAWPRTAACWRWIATRRP